MDEFEASPARDASTARPPADPVESRPSSPAPVTLYSPRFVTNMGTLAARFTARCDKSHEHATCSGYEGGELRSTFAQCYPAPFCKAVADAVEEAVAAST